jgi:flavodoxin short chain
MLTATEFDASMIDSFDAVAFGCPAMGSEELEDSEFAPMFESCEAKLSGKKIALFGSYGWGDGEWMRNWEDTCKGDGAVLASESVICNDAPDDDAIESCKALGASLV